MSLLASIAFALLVNPICQDPDEGKPRSEELEISWAHPGHGFNSPGVSRLAVSPDGIHLASASGVESTVKIWNIKDRKYERSLYAYPYLPVTSVDYSADGKKLLVTFMNESVIYDTKKWTVLKRYEHTESTDVLFAGNSLFLADKLQAFDQDERTSAWTLPRQIENIDFGHFRSKLTGGSARTYISPDRTKFLISGGVERKPVYGNEERIGTYVTYVSLANLQVANEVTYPASNPPYDPQIRATIVGWRSPSSLVCLFGKDLVWTNLNMQNAKVFDTLPVDSISAMFVTSLHSVGGGFLAVTYPNPNRPKEELIQLYDKRSMQRAGAPISVRYGQGSGIALSNDRPFVFGNLLFELDWSGKPVWQLTRFCGNTSSLFISKNTNLAAIALNNCIQVWNPTKPEEEWMIRTPDPVKASKIPRNLPPSDIIATDICLWNGKAVGATIGPFVFVTDAADGKNTVWHKIGSSEDLRDRPIVRYVKGGEQFIAGTQRGSGGLKKYDTLTGKVLGNYVPSAQVQLLASTDQYVAAVTGSKMRVWEVESGKLLYESTVPNSGITRIALDDSRKLLITGNSEGLVIVIGFANGKLYHQMQCDKRAVVNLVVTPDGRLVTRTESAYSEFPLRIWDIATGEELGHFLGEVGPCDIPESLSTDMYFNAKTNELVMGRNDCMVIAFKMPMR